MILGLFGRKKPPALLPPTILPPPMRFENIKVAAPTDDEQIKSAACYARKVYDELREQGFNSEAAVHVTAGIMSGYSKPVVILEEKGGEPK